MTMFLKVGRSPGQEILKGPDKQASDEQSSDYSRDIWQVRGPEFGAW